MNQSLPNCSGVYRLYLGGLCVYVGASVNIKHRISCHRSKIEFDRVEWEAHPLERIDRKEQTWIDTYRPTLNKREALYPYRCKDPIHLGRIQAKRSWPFVHGRPGTGILVHRVKHVEVSWPEPWEGDLAKKDRALRIHITTSCGTCFFSLKGARLLKDMPDGTFECQACIRRGRPTFKYDTQGRHMREESRKALKRAVTSERAA